MHLQRKDTIATGLVAAAGIVYGLWATEAAPPGMSSIRVTGSVVLALGFAASATAVVPSFDRLLHGSKIYLAVTSLLGLVALIGGVQTLVAESDAGLTVVICTMVLLWATATVHHGLEANDVATPRERHPRLAHH